MKTCSFCKKEKPESAFSVRRASPDGLNYKCRECNKEYLKVWQANNPNAFKRWYSENKEERAQYWRGWYEANKDHRSRSYAEWAKQNKHIVNALIAKRIAAKKQSTPRWANQDAIREVYRAAAERTEQTGVRHEVDHIYPLQGKRVCGLHCEANLRVMTKTENIRKSNRMPKDLAHEWRQTA
jgi:hypothetical protein